MLAVLGVEHNALSIETPECPPLAGPHLLPRAPQQVPQPALERPEPQIRCLATHR